VLGALSRVRAGLGSAPRTREEDEETLARFASGVSAVEEYLASVRFTIEVRDESYVYWYEPHPEPALVAVPLHAGETLASACLRAAPRLVLTSATLAAGGAFEHFLGSIGLPVDAVETLVTETPFRLEEQVIAMAPPMPSPDDPAFTAEAVRLLAPLAGLGRKVLALFTSHEQLRQVHEGLSRALEGSAIEVLGQGLDGSRERITQAFRRSRGAILLGTSSFWEGVDFPGEELEILVVARLPFPVPSQPIVEARCEAIRARGGAPFSELMMPEAILRFRQGFGRLIRRGTDRGVFIVLDPRIRTASYRARFERALPVRLVPVADLDETLGLTARWFGLEDSREPRESREEKWT
jgi:ATP-dependent DNA helicase DinG